MLYRKLIANDKNKLNKNQTTKRYVIINPLFRVEVYIGVSGWLSETNLKQNYIIISCFVWLTEAFS